MALWTHKRSNLLSPEKRGLQGSISLRVGMSSKFDWNPISVDHYSDVIMSATAYQITGVSIICSTSRSSADQRKQQSRASKLRVTGLCEGNPPVTGGFPSQRASNAENVFIWWRHRDILVHKRNIAHATTAMLLWNVQNVVIGSLKLSNYQSAYSRSTLLNHVLSQL